MIRTKSGWSFTKQERQERWDRCTKYILRYSTLTAARKAAARDGFKTSTSVWITALSKILGEIHC